MQLTLCDVLFDIAEWEDDMSGISETEQGNRLYKQEAVEVIN
jgi:hypothetical protein